MTTQWRLSSRGVIRKLFNLFESVYHMKKVERYLNLTKMFLSGEEVTAYKYMKKYGLVYKTAQRDLNEYQSIAYNTLGLTINVEHHNSGFVYQARNVEQVIFDFK